MCQCEKARESHDTAAIERTLDALMQAQQKASAALDRNAGAGAPGGESAGPSAGNGQADDVIDAEIVDDKK